ncbi:hypothetical protein [Candidatus Terasakiella magnetica]|nr:hypothetical protein [Candidatus Terasakiella magnetica]
MIRRTLWIALIGVFSLGITSTEACPKKIVAVMGDDIARHALPILINIYDSIGCSTEFDFLPGRRGILEFNQGRIDGELYRNPIAEQFYSRAFTRSSKPFVTVEQGIFLNPKYNDYTSVPIGYISGIKWHDLFVLNTLANTKRLVRFNQKSKLMDAYEQGRIKGFLSSTLSVKLYNDEVGFKHAPQLSLAIGTVNLYHYLAKEHATIMEKIDQYVSSHKPFTQLNSKVYAKDRIPSTN